MLAAQVFDKNILVKEIEKPVLSTQGAIIKVIGCGLCGSDIVKFRHNLMKDGGVLGHEVVGEIIEINTQTSFKVGDKVALGHHYPCFDCVYCKNSNYSMCSTFKQTNILPGGFAEYIYITEGHLENTVSKLSNNISFETASFMEPLGCCVRAVKKADIKNGDNVLIIGLGSIGLLMGQCAGHFGGNVIGSDLLDERLDLANKVNFDHVLKYENDEISAQKIKDLTLGIGVDKVFLTAGSSATLNFALKCVRNGGTIVVFSSVDDDLKGYSNNEIYYRELNIFGSYSPAPEDLHYAMELLQKGSVIVENFSTEYNICDINQAIEDTIKNKILKAYITFDKK